MKPDLLSVFARVDLRTKAALRIGPGWRAVGCEYDNLRPDNPVHVARMQPLYISEETKVNVWVQTLGGYTPDSVTVVYRLLANEDFLTSPTSALVTATVLGVWVTF